VQGCLGQGLLCCISHHMCMHSCIGGFLCAQHRTCTLVLQLDNSTSCEHQQQLPKLRMTVQLLQVSVATRHSSQFPVVCVVPLLSAVHSRHGGNAGAHHDQLYTQVSCSSYPTYSSHKLARKH
jgi:hypothetical protein